jgi:pteridine reductase
MTSDSPRIVFVTGSGRRLGRQIAYALAEAGFDIVLHAHRSIDGMLEARDRIAVLGRRVWTVTGDLALVSDIRAIGESIRSSVPQLDVLVNNAGVFPTAAFSEVTEEIWDDTLAVNTRAMFFMARECAASLRNSGGCIVNIASAGAFQAWKTHIPYNVSKAGVVMLTRALAKTLAPEVRVNALAPGVILIPGEEEREHLPADRFPLRRYGTIDDVTRSLLFLIEARYLTGHVLPVDGGFSEST